MKKEKRERKKAALLLVNTLLVNCTTSFLGLLSKQKSTQRIERRSFSLQEIKQLVRNIYLFIFTEVNIDKVVSNVIVIICCGFTTSQKSDSDDVAFVCLLVGDVYCLITPTDRCIHAISSELLFWVPILSPSRITVTTLACRDFIERLNSGLFMVVGRG